ncbi:MAG: alpha/beta hydrolase [Rhodocyclaceae bacterium]|nr:MAG: alpha/beta hydrolase [Rhodocyclaceae bacterium]
MELTVNGLPSYAYTGGKLLKPGLDATLPAVVFIHGAEIDHSCWGLQSRWFANHGWVVLAVDLPGHGRSAGAPLSSIQEIAAWIIALLDAAGIARAALVGHSMGSLAALEAAASFPERISRIALLGNATPMPVSKSLLDAARDDPTRAEGMINAWSHSAHGHIGGNSAPGIWMYGANRRLMARAGRAVLFNDLSACNNYAQGLENAVRVHCPALLLCGGRDQMTALKSARNLAKTLPDARLQVLAGTGHSMMGEQPDAVLDALRAFLAENQAI